MFKKMAFLFLGLIALQGVAYAECAMSGDKADCASGPKCCSPKTNFVPGNKK